MNALFLLSLPLSAPALAWLAEARKPRPLSS